MNIYDELSVVIFDMEVLNFELDQDVLVQFSARKYYQNKMVDKLNILIETPLILDSNFVKRTRITKGLLNKKGINIYQAKQLIYNFIKNEILISYKGDYFYFAYLDYLFSNKLNNPKYDVIKLANELDLINNNYDKLSLEEFAHLLNIKFDYNKWDNANYDVSIIEKIWFKLKSIHKKGK